MPDVRTKGWARIEGCQISDLYKQYGTFTGIPNAEQHIYYGTPEIQFTNPYSSTHSVVYTVKSIKNYFGYNQIHDIDQNWANFKNSIQSWMQNNPIDQSDVDTAFYYVGKPFTVNTSCVIFYDDSSKASITGSKYRYYFIVLVDEYAIPNVISINAEYKGDAVPIGEEIDEDYLTVTAVYDDGNSIKIDTGYTLEPADKIVTQLGANLFTAFYVDPEDEVNSATFLVQGCKNLTSISGYWDGDLVAYRKKADRKYFVIIAQYSDDTQSTVTDFEFPNGNTVTELNHGLIDIFYKGKSCQVQVTPFEVKLSRLIAFYNGPQVEVGNEFQTQYLTIKVYYSSGEEIERSYYDTITVDDCVLEDKLVSKEGVNTFDISYENEFGLISTSFAIIGFIPDVKPVDMEVSYNGPAVYQGKTFDLERILCNVYYNNGTIKTVKNFTTSTNVINEVGSNEIMIYYIEGTTSISKPVWIEGIEIDTTTDNNFYPTSLVNNYPVATILNNRYRGPAEGVKTNNYAGMIINNINELYKIFNDLEKQYNSIMDSVAGETGIKITTLNNVSFMKQELNNILNDYHYSTGRYKSEDIIS
jgi:hypothetical protein